MQGGAIFTGGQLPLRLSNRKVAPVLPGRSSPNVALNVEITTRPDDVWMLQMTPNLIDEESGALASKRYLMIDRDTKYTQ